MSDMKTVLDAVSILVTPATHASSSNVSTAGSEVFHKMLLQNMEKLQTTINTEPKFQSLRSMIEKTDICQDEDINWKFATLCLELLNRLQESIRRASDEFEDENRSKPLTPSQAPALSPDVLSVSQQKTVLTCLQFVACLGLCPQLHSGVGVPVHRRSGFGSLVKENVTLSEREKACRLVSCVRVLMQCVDVSCVGALVLSRHLSDLLAALLQICFCRNKSDATTHQTCLPVAMDTKSESLTPAAAVDRILQQSQLSAGNERNEKTAEKRNLSDVGSEKGRGSDVGEISVTDRDVKDDSDSGHHHGDDCETCGNNLRSVSEQTCRNVTDSQNTCKISDCVNSSGSSHNAKRCKYSTKQADLTTSRPVDSSPPGDVKGHICCSSDSADLEFCEKSLQHLLDHVSPPILVRELLLLQGGAHQKPQKKKDVNFKSGLSPSPVWMRKACGHLLTRILTRPNGVLHVLKGMLDPSGSDPGYWKKCDAVAKIISHCPMTASSVEEYYKQVCPQVLSLLRQTDTAGYMLRVVSSFIRDVNDTHPELSHRHLIQPLIQPLTTSCSQHPDVESTTSTCVLVSDRELENCIQNLHKIVVVSSVLCSSVLLQLCPVSQPLFQLFSYCQHKHTQLSALCKAILLTFLKQCDTPVSLSLLSVLALGEETKVNDLSFHCLHPEISFHTNTSGQVEVIHNPDISEREQDVDYDAVVENLTEIIKPLEKCDVAGEFFLFLLQEFTKIISDESNPVKTEVENFCEPGQELREIEKREEKMFNTLKKRILIVSLLSAMCDKLGPACLKSTKHILQFVMTTLERAVEVLKLTDEGMTAMFETETIVMAIGLVTAVMSGEKKLSDSDHAFMQKLLPLLEEIGANHTNDFVKEMAADVRIAIATRGAVWSDLIKTESTDLRSMSEKVKNTTTSKTVESKKKKILIEELPETETEEVKEKLDEKDSALKQLNVKCLSGTENRQEFDSNSSSMSDSSHLTKSDSSKLASSDSSKMADFAREKPQCTEMSELQQAFDELCDPLIPVRGHGLIRLTKLVESRKEQLDDDKKETILHVFLENLDHPDSYLYLASVNGLAALADTIPHKIVPRLAREFADFDSAERRVKRSVEMRLKLGEALVKAFRNLGDMMPVYRDTLLSAILSGVRDDDDDVRASSLSNLADVCRLLNFSVSPVINEIVSCCGAVLKSDKSANVRKAAALTLTSLLEGLGKNSLQVLSGVLQDLYHLLKLIHNTDPDDGVKFHILGALQELDKTARDFLFPKQSLVKKITVLHPE